MAVLGIAPGYGAAALGAHAGGGTLWPWPSCATSRSSRSGSSRCPSELVPLHIFEERYKTMMARVLEEEGEFGIVWVADDGLRPVGCACEIAEVLERMEDGRLNLVARGTRAVPHRDPPGRAPLPGRRRGVPRRPRRGARRGGGRGRARGVRRARRAGDRPHARSRTRSPAMSAYEMAATVEFGLDAKQGLLDLRSETARLKLVARLFRAAIKRLDFVERAQARRAIERQGPLLGLSTRSGAPVARREEHEHRDDLEPPEVHQRGEDDRREVAEPRERAHRTGEPEARARHRRAGSRTTRRATGTR